MNRPLPLVLAVPVSHSRLHHPPLSSQKTPCIRNENFNYSVFSFLIFENLSPWVIHLTDIRVMSRLLFGRSWNTWIVPPQSPEPVKVVVHLIEKSHIIVLLFSVEKHYIYLFKNCTDVELYTANEGPVNVLFGISIITVL